MHATKRKGGISKQSDTVVKRSKSNKKRIPSDKVYCAVYRAAPNACLFTIVPGSDCTISQPSPVLPIRNEKCSDMMSDNIEK